jgi:hypothetical protein
MEKRCLFAVYEFIHSLCSSKYLQIVQINLILLKTYSEGTVIGRLMMTFLCEVVFWNYSQTRLQRTPRDRPFLFVITGVCYDRVDMFSKMTNLT